MSTGRVTIRILLALLSGLLLVLLYPPFSFPLLAPIAVTPLCLALGKEFRPWARFALGYATGLVLWAGTCWWIAQVLDVHGGMGAAGGWGSFALFCILKSIHYGLFGLLAGVLVRHWYGPPAIALLWAVLERTQEPTTLFGWLMLGDAGIDIGLPLRVAPYTGVYGLSFLFALMGTCFAVVLLRQPRQRALWGLLIVAPVLLPPLPVGLRPGAKAAVVQPNFEVDTGFGRAEADMLSGLSAKAIAGGAVDVTLWPETPVAVQNSFIESLARPVALITGAPVLFGTVMLPEKGPARNSAEMMDARGKPVARYDKIYLVPFGEYVPAPFGFVNQVSDQVGEYEPGTEIVIPPLGEHKAGVFICYESAVSHHVRQFALRGADVFFNLSNDGYFFRTQAREQHLQLVRMRAVENRRWVVRATNNGITVSIDPAGTIRETLPSFQAASGQLSYGYVNETTVYTRHGDWFIWLGAALVVAALIASQWPSYDGSPVRRRP